MFNREEAEVSLRQKCVLAAISLILIGSSPVWSQGLLQKLDPDEDGYSILADFRKLCFMQSNLTFFAEILVPPFEKGKS